jgi:hypothetical protein
MARAPDDAENFVRDALAQSAAVAIVAGDASAELDESADGVAARLRFAIAKTD